MKNKFRSEISSGMSRFLYPSINPDKYQQEYTMNSSQKVLKYLNQARTNPESLIPYIQNTLAKFIDENTYRVTPTLRMKTNQGRPAWLEAIAFLKDRSPIGQLKSSKGLWKAAEFHAVDLVSHHTFGHTGSNGSTLQQRICTFTDFNYKGRIGQNVASLPRTCEKDVEFIAVVNLIIDDGVKSRGHRQSIFSTDFNFAGIGVEQGQQVIVVIDYSTYNLEPKSSTDHKPHKKQKAHQVHGSPKLIDDDVKQNHVKKNPANKNPDTKVTPATEQRRIVSQSTSTSSKSFNGVGVTTKTVKIKYSDGTTEVTVSETPI